MSEHVHVNPDPCVETDARGRISYTVYDNLSSLKIQVPSRKECDSQEEYEEYKKWAQRDAAGRRITLPTPFPQEWKNVKMDKEFTASTTEVPVGAGHSFRFCPGSYYGIHDLDGLIFMHDKKSIHPHLKPVPWFPEEICDAPDYEGPRFPPGVEDKGDSDPVWHKVAQDLHMLSYDCVPHWTLRFKTPEIQVKWAHKPLPDFDHRLFKHPDISHIIFVFDETRQSDRHREAVAEITRTLLSHYVQELEEELESQEKPRKRRAV